MTVFKQCLQCRYISEATPEQINILLIHQFRCKGCEEETKHTVARKESIVEMMSRQVRANTSGGTINTPGADHRDYLD
jgi:Fe-S oxidoreductase